MNWFEKVAVALYLYHLAVPSAEWALWWAAGFATVTLALEFWDARPKG